VPEQRPRGVSRLDLNPWGRLLACPERDELDLAVKGRVDHEAMQRRAGSLRLVKRLALLREPRAFEGDGFGHPRGDFAFGLSSRATSMKRRSGAERWAALG